jgi:hypothetical protein
MRAKVKSVALFLIHDVHASWLRRWYLPAGSGAGGVARAPAAEIFTDKIRQLINSSRYWNLDLSTRSYYPLNIGVKKLAGLDKACAVPHMFQIKVGH